MNFLSFFQPSIVKIGRELKYLLNILDCHLLFVFVSFQSRLRVAKSQNQIHFLRPLLNSEQNQF